MTRRHREALDRLTNAKARAVVKARRKSPQRVAPTVEEQKPEAMPPKKKGLLARLKGK